MEEESKQEMKQWLITDKRVVEALQKNGFVCQIPLERAIEGSISFYTQPVGKGHVSNWLETDCPIPINGSYALPDGTIIQSEGTSLVLLRQA